TVYTVGLLGEPPSGTTAAITLSSTLNGVAGPSGTINTSGGEITLVFKTPGTYTLTAVFAGDSDDAPATSSTLTTVVAPQGPPQSYTPTLDNYNPAVGVNADIEAINIPKTSYVDVPFTLTSVNGFTDSIRIL